MTKVITEFMTNTKSYFSGLERADKGNWTLFEKSWLFISTAAIIVASIWTWDATNVTASWVALISSVTGIWCVILVAKGKISNYIFGLINVVFYAWAAYSWKLYGDFMLNAFYFLPMQFYGWYIWTKPNFMKGNDNVIIKFLSNKNRLILALISIVATIGYGFVLKAIGGLTPFFDAGSTTLSVIAMVLMSRRFMEQWILWIVVDVVTVYMWANIVFNVGSLFNMGILIMWIAFLINAVWGFINWVKIHKNQEV